MSNIKFYPYDLCKESPIAASSEQPNFPVENVQDRCIQKPWRSRYGAGSGWGNFDINNGNNKLYFRELASLINIDSDMEVWTNPTTLTNWTKGVDAGCSLDKEATEKHRGSYSAKFTNDAVAGHIVYVTQDVVLGTGGVTEYEMSIWYKSSTLGKTISIYIYDKLLNVSLNASGTWVPYITFIPLPTALAWTNHKIALTKHPTYVNYTMAVLTDSNIHGLASSYFDEFELYPYNDFTATLSNGQYNADNLCTEISTQLDAAGAYTYTANYNDVTNKFEINSSLPASLFKLREQITTAAIWSTIGFTTGIETDWDYQFVGDEIRIHAYEYITISPGSFQTVFAIFLMNCNIQSSAYVKLQTSNDGFATTPIDASIVYGNNGNMALILTVPANALEFRVYLNDPSNPDGYLQIGRIFLAYQKQSTAALSVVEPTWGFAPKGGRKQKDNSTFDQSDGGQASSIIRFKETSRQLSFEMIDNVSAFDLMLLEVGQTIPVIAVLKPFNAGWDYLNPENNFRYVRMGAPAWKRIGGLIEGLTVDITEEP